MLTSILTFSSANLQVGAMQKCKVLYSNLIFYVLFLNAFFAAVVCPDPGNIKHAVRYGSMLTYSDTVYYSCLTGYKRASGIPGNIQIICGFDGQWNGWDTCERMCTFFLKHFGYWVTLLYLDWWLIFQPCNISNT